MRKLFTLLRYYLMVVTLLFVAPVDAGDIAVIVNMGNTAKQMSTDQVADLYLGRTRVFANKTYALVFDQPRNSPLREAFFTRLIGMSPAQINSYWARLMFAGQTQPPQVLSDDKQMLEVVRTNPGAVGYIDSVNVDNSVRVVLLIKE